MEQCRSTRRAFTLVELLVVIGIIALLIGVLLPVLGKVQKSSRSTKCIANLRSIVQAFREYSVENKDALPYGFIYDKQNPLNGRPVPPNNPNFICWVSQVGKYINKKGDGRFGPADDDINYNSVVRCPEAMQVIDHLCSYVAHIGLLISPYDEFTYAGTLAAQRAKPGKLSTCYPDTALIWDSSIALDWQNNLGFLLGADVDFGSLGSQRIWAGAQKPQNRYYRRGRENVWPKPYHPNQPIAFPLDSYPWTNVDKMPRTQYPFQGNLRFRHGNNNLVNVGFADGSVRTFEMKFEKDGITPKDETSHNVLRRYFMSKWPTGLKPVPGIGYDP